MSEQETRQQMRQHQSFLCPACRIDLVMSERQNVEIDYCPQCRGIWLCRGELDKIIERSLAQSSVQPSVQRPWSEPRNEPPTGGQGRYEGQQGPYGQQGQRRKSWLSDIFD